MTQPTYYKPHQLAHGKMYYVGTKNGNFTSRPTRIDRTPAQKVTKILFENGVLLTSLTGVIFQDPFPYKP